MHLFLLIGLVAFSILAVLSRDLLKSAISLAVASVFLALVFFRMNAVYAGVFEVSVVAGLITVLFITAIALTRSDGDVAESKRHLLVFPLFFLALVVIDILVMKKLLGRIPAISRRRERHLRPGAVEPAHLRPGRPDRRHLRRRAGRAGPVPPGRSPRTSPKGDHHE